MNRMGLKEPKLAQPEAGISPGRRLRPTVDATCALLYASPANSGP
jgi:hypothetical protein